MSPCECGCGTPVRARFVSGHNMQRAGYVVEDRDHDTACWIWQGVPHGDNGYGRVRVNREKIQAHRWMYEQHIGPIPEGMVIDHLCRVPLCVNPAHLEPVTGTENVRRGNVCKLTMEKAEAIRAAARRAMETDPLTSKGELRRRLPPGVGVALAREYGVSLGTIFRVCKGQIWA